MIFVRFAVAVSYFANKVAHNIYVERYTCTHMFFAAPLCGVCHITKGTELQPHRQIRFASNCNISCCVTVRVITHFMGLHRHALLWC